MVSPHQKRKATSKGMDDVGHSTLAGTCESPQHAVESRAQQLPPPTPRHIRTYVPYAHIFPIDFFDRHAELLLIRQDFRILHYVHTVDAIDITVERTHTHGSTGRQEAENSACGLYVQFCYYPCPDCCIATDTLRIIVSPRIQ